VSRMECRLLLRTRSRAAPPLPVPVANSLRSNRLGDGDGEGQGSRGLVPGTLPSAATARQVPAPSARHEAAQHGPTPGQESAGLRTLSLDCGSAASGRPRAIRGRRITSGDPKESGLVARL